MKTFKEILEALEESDFNEEYVNIILRELGDSFIIASKGGIVKAFSNIKEIGVVRLINELVVRDEDFNSLLYQVITTAIKLKTQHPDNIVVYDTPLKTIITKSTESTNSNIVGVFTKDNKAMTFLHGNKFSLFTALLGIINDENDSPIQRVLSKLVNSAITHTTKGKEGGLNFTELNLN